MSILSYFVFQTSSDSGSKEYRFPGGIIQLAQYWKNYSGLSNNEKIFSKFLNQVIEKSVLVIVKMDDS